MKPQRRLVYLTISDLDRMVVARDIEELAAIAIEVLRRLPQPVCWVAGPITSGGRKPEENRRRLSALIFRLKNLGISAFEYVPFQKQAMKLLKREFGKEDLSLGEQRQLQEQLRDRLYVPIFQSGLIAEVRLMPQSESSLNAQWMRGFARCQKIPIIHVAEEIVAAAQAAVSK